VNTSILPSSHEKRLETFPTVFFAWQADPVAFSSFVYTMISDEAEPGEVEVWARHKIEDLAGTLMVNGFFTVDAVLEIDDNDLDLMKINLPGD
jgi:hypothetical protein